MPSAHRTLSVADVHDHIRDEITGSLSEGCVGVELEWLTVYRDNPVELVSHDLIKRLLEPERPLPSGGRLNFEPGGQLEVSSAPASSVGVICADAASADIELIQTKLEPAGIRLLGIGLDPCRHNPRVLDVPRYQAMEKYLDSQWPNGRRMMRDTASVHVNLDAGLEDQAGRWRFVHDLGPMLVACFSNSALAGGKPTGWRSSRMAIWQSIDPSRTRPVALGPDPASDWAGYALAARVMFMGDGTALRAIHSGLTFGQWMDSGHELGYPTLEDLDLHLTTLFPPIRPKAWLELRMIDALPEPWWRVPVAVCMALTYDRAAARRVQKYLEPARGLWVEAAMYGMSHPTLALAARVCFANAINALEGMEVDSKTLAATHDYYDRYVRRGRSPADDQLDFWTAMGAINETNMGLEKIWT